MILAAAQTKLALLIHPRHHPLNSRTTVAATLWVWDDLQFFGVVNGQLFSPRNRGGGLSRKYLAQLTGGSVFWSPDAGRRRAFRGP
jgi:hypothetical protein